MPSCSCANKAPIDFSIEIRYKIISSPRASGIMVAGEESTFFMFFKGFVIEVSSIWKQHLRGVSVALG